MDLIERYRQYAAECIRMAEETQNKADKAIWLSLAERWKHLAENALSARRRSMKDIANYHPRPH